MTNAAWWFPILVGWCAHWLWANRHAPWLDDPDPLPSEQTAAHERIVRRLHDYRDEPV